MVRGMSGRIAEAVDAPQHSGPHAEGGAGGALAGTAEIYKTSRVLVSFLSSTFKKVKNSRIHVTSESFIISFYEKVNL